MMWRAALLLALLAADVVPAAAQPGTWPTAVELLELEPLAGDWYEVATYGSWSHRRCVSDTRFLWVVRDARTIDVRSTCTTASGDEIREGRLRAPVKSQGGRLTARFAPALFAWLPAVWNDHWVLAVGDRRAWLLVGDRRRERLSVLSRWVSLDEASLATAIGAARVQGYNVDALADVRHAPGSTGPVR